MSLGLQACWRSEGLSGPSASSCSASLCRQQPHTHLVLFAESNWARFFPKPPEPSPHEAQKSVRKEMIGFLLLGPASASLMIYDLIFGLEHHEYHTIPP